MSENVKECQHAKFLKGDHNMSEIIAYKTFTCLVERW